ncbi:hypothetical protein [Leptothoe spongobia]|uniref:Uncharacterized protein n=1 Tax=Leptothoe spongobia TAU-MAC 1115 TaxID=1967444 RepID=A0A947DG24_9CYAN|nr:hypothetical protein [Leptothoe spongobia]MBT9316265.1 hypothetical protein [Leptothoe spongobia TAU-MAC 1115]
MDQGEDLRVQLRLYADKPREKQVAEVLQNLANSNGESVNETAKRILMVFAKAAAQSPAINLTLAQDMATALVGQAPTGSATPATPQFNSASELPKPTSQPQKNKTKPEPQPPTESPGIPEIDMSEL